MDGKTQRDRIDRLVRVLDEHAVSVQCEECEAMLPTLADEEMAGLRISERYPELALHIDTCPTCGPAFADLLDVLLADERGEFTAPDAVPPPRLPLSLRLERFTILLARAVLRVNGPSLEMLSDVARVFFERLSETDGQFTLAYAPAAVMGLGGESPALPALVAAYRTAAAVIQSRPPGGLRALHAEGKLEPLIRARAEEEAKAARLSRSEASVFVAEVTREALANAEALFALEEHQNSG